MASSKRERASGEPSIKGPGSSDLTLKTHGASGSKRHGWRTGLASKVAAWAGRVNYFFRHLKQTSHTYLSVEEEIRNFIRNELLFGEEISFADEDSFLEEGLIDSTGILEVVGFLESRYKFEVSDEELRPENLDSVCRLGKYVRAKCGLSGYEELGSGPLQEPSRSV